MAGARLLPAHRLCWLASRSPRAHGGRGWRHDLVVLERTGAVLHAFETTPSEVGADVALALSRRALALEGRRVPPWECEPLLFPASIRAHARAFGRAVAARSSCAFQDAELASDLERLASRLEYRRVRGLVAPFLRLLDPEALGAMAAAGTGCVRHYLHLACFQASPKRRQAAAILPLFAKSLATKKPIVSEIDAARPFLAALSKDAGVSVPFLRRLSGVAAREVPLLEGEDLGRILRGLSGSGLDPASVPTRRAGWSELLSLLRAQPHWERLRPEGPDLASAAKGRFGAFAQGLLDASGGVALDRAFAGTQDAARAASRALLEPIFEALRESSPARTALLRADDLESLAVGFVFAKLSPAKVLRRSAAIHSRPELLAPPRRSRRMSWDPLFPGVLAAPGGALLRALSSSAELEAEGARMRHCVGSYDSACLSGAHVLSISAPDGSPLSTAEIAPIEPGRPLRVVQHQGVGNQEPPASAIEALSWLRSGALEGEIAIDWTIAARIASRDRMGSARERADLDAVPMALDLWRPFLEKPWRSLPPLAFVEAASRALLARAAASDS